MKWPYVEGKTIRVTIIIDTSKVRRKPMIQEMVERFVLWRALGFRGRWERFADDSCRWLAWLLPRRLVYWAGVRIWAHATTGPVGGSGPILRLDHAIRAWGVSFGKLADGLDDPAGGDDGPEQQGETV